MFILLLFLICFYSLIPGKDPPPGLFPRDCIPKSGPHEKPKKPPEKRKNKNNITSRKAAKSDLLPAVLCCAALGTAGPLPPGRQTSSALVG